MTAASALRMSTRWLGLDDHPAALCPLELGIVRLGVQGRARSLLQALNLPDSDQLSTRLLAQNDGRVSLHAAHLDILTAPLPPEQARAFREALGVTPEPDVPAPPAARPRPDFLHQAALGTRGGVRAAVPGDVSGAALSPATLLSRAMQRLSDDPTSLSVYNAVLASEALRAVTWHWLDLRSALHLELLGGVGAPGTPGAEAASAALHQLQSTLTGARRGAARSLVEVARTQLAALDAHQAAQRQARRDVIRAAVQAAATLARAGWLIRPADARWLSPTELRDALDGTLDPATLRGLTQLRRLQHVPAPGTPTWTLVDRHHAALPLSTGVRDGVIQPWIPGHAVPEGQVALCADVQPWHWAQLSGAAALILDRAGLLSMAALHERRVGRPAVSLRGRRPEWLQPGAFVRVNAHQGSVTLLRRAESPSGADDVPVASTPITTVHEDAVIAGHAPVAPIPLELTGISLDFDPA